MCEISIIVNAHQEKISDETKTTILTNFALAQNIAVCVGRVLNGKQLPTAEETYPELFNDTKAEPVEVDEDKVWQMHRDQMLAFAELHNAKRKLKLGGEV